MLLLRYSEAVRTSADALGNDAKDFRLESAQLNLRVQRPILELEVLLDKGRLAFPCLVPNRLNAVDVV